jgi:hypothetical protein
MWIVQTRMQILDSFVLVERPDIRRRSGRLTRLPYIVSEFLCHVRVGRERIVVEMRPTPMEKSQR